MIVAKAKLKIYLLVMKYWSLSWLAMLAEGATLAQTLLHCNLRPSMSNTPALTRTVIYDERSVQFVPTDMDRHLR